MDQKLRNRILDAGIVPPASVKEMEQWQGVPQGSADKIGSFSPEKVDRMREDLELRGLPTLHETVLDVDKIMEKSGRMVRLFNAHDLGYGDKVGYVWGHAGVDILKRYIFKIPEDAEVYKSLSSRICQMSIIRDDSLEDPLNIRTITEVSVLYSTIEEGQSIPTHWFCVTESAGEGNILRAK